MFHIMDLPTSNSHPPNLLVPELPRISGPSGNMATSQCSLDSLPVELLRPIIASLAVKELKVLRLMNRKLCNVASETLFKTVTISTNATSYIQLLNVATSEFYSAQVRHLNWILLDSDDNTEFYWQEVGYWPQEVGFWPPCSEKLWMGGILPLPGRLDVRYCGLNLQCQLLRRFPNVETIYFRSAVDSERHWDQGNENNEMRSFKIWRSSKENDLDLYRPYPDDFFHILSYSELKPRLFRTNEVELHLGYSGNHELERVEILPYRRDVSLQGTQGQMPRYMVQFKKKYFLETQELLKKLARSSDSLRTLNISGIRVWLDAMGILLMAADKLESLVLSNVKISNYDEGHPMQQLLFLLLKRGEKVHSQKVKVTLQDLKCRRCIGTLNANEQQVEGWMEGWSNELLELTASSFEYTPREYSSSDEEDDDDDDDDMMSSEEDDDEGKTDGEQLHDPEDIKADYDDVADSLEGGDPDPNMEDASRW